jgi:hypothetical protein
MGVVLAAVDVVVGSGPGAVVVVVGVRMEDAVVSEPISVPHPARSARTRALPAIAMPQRALRLCLLIVAHSFGA